MGIKKNTQPLGRFRSSSPCLKHSLIAIANAKPHPRLSEHLAETSPGGPLGPLDVPVPMAMFPGSSLVVRTLVENQKDQPCLYSL